MMMIGALFWPKEQTAQPGNDGSRAQRGCCRSAIIAGRSEVAALHTLSAALAFDSLEAEISAPSAQVTS